MLHRFLAQSGQSYSRYENHIFGCHISVLRLKGKVNEFKEPLSPGSTPQMRVQSVLGVGGGFVREAQLQEWQVKVRTDTMCRLKKDRRSYLAGVTVMSKIGKLQSRKGWLR